MPCIFVINVVTCASLQREAPGKCVFRDLVVFTKSGIILVHDAICSACFLVIRAPFEDDQ